MVVMSDCIDCEADHEGLDWIMRVKMRLVMRVWIVGSIMIIGYKLNQS